MPSTDDPTLPSAVRRPRRAECARCQRPENVCLCQALPEEQLQLAGRVVVLQHPHEAKKRLATVPLLQKVLAGVELLRSRTYQPDHPSHSPLRLALEGAAAGRFPLLVLFPGAGARDVREVGAELHAAAGQQQAVRRQGKRQPQQQQAAAAADCDGTGAASVGRSSTADPLYVLLVIDGTWKQAKEMFKSVAPLVLAPGGPGTRVQLPAARRGAADAVRGDETPSGAALERGQQRQQGPPEQPAGGPLLLRMEPMEGCLTTCEAVARALGCLEPAGPLVRDALLRPLAQLAAFQAQWDPTLAVRLQQEGAGYSQARCRMGMGRLGVLELLA